MTLVTGSLLFGCGLAAGFIDAIAGGGGLITVPALLWAGLPPPVALGTNKLQAACGTLLAVIHYARHRLLAWREVRLAVAVTFVAALVGTGVVTHIQAAALGRVIPWLLLGVGIYTAWRPSLGTESRPAKWNVAPFAWVCGSVLGFYDGFFGPGTGSFWTLAYVGLRGFELRRATAHTKAVNLTSNVASLILFLLTVSIRYDIAAVMIAGQLLGAQAGAHLVIRRGARFIRALFLAVVFALTLKLFWSYGLHR
jgi:uncharacterized protein